MFSPLRGVIGGSQNIPNNWAFWDGSADGSDFDFSFTPNTEAKGAPYTLTTSKVYVPFGTALSGDYRIRGHIGNVSSTTITWGAEQALKTADFVVLFSADVLDSTRTINLYRDSSAALKAYVATVSGDTITPQSERTLTATNPTTPYVLKTSTDKVLFFYSSTNGTPGLKCICSTISTNTVNSPGTELLIDSGVSINYMAACYIADDVVALIWSTSEPKVKTCIVTLSGTTPSKGTTQDVAAIQGDYVQICRLSTTRAIGSFINTSDELKSSVLTINGNSISPSSSVISVTSTANQMGILGRSTIGVNHSQYLSFYRGATNRINGICGTIQDANTINYSSPVVFIPTTNFGVEANVSFIDDNTLFLFYGGISGGNNVGRGKIIKRA